MGRGDNFYCCYMYSARFNSYQCCNVTTISKKAKVYRIISYQFTALSVTPSPNVHPIESIDIHNIGSD